MSSHGKVSVASSGDDVESLQSVSMGSTGRLASRRVGAFPSNKSPASSKKPNKVMLSSSAPKRSFDSALRQMVLMFCTSVFLDGDGFYII